MFSDVDEYSFVLLSFSLNWRVRDSNLTPLLVSEMNFEYYLISMLIMLHDKVNESVLLTRIMKRAN